MTELTEIEELDSGANVPGATGKRRFFVVHEEIKDPKPQGRSRGRRAIVDFVGRNRQFNLGPNVMLSFSFDVDNLPLARDLEVLAWDNHNGVYNYYLLYAPEPANLEAGGDVAQGRSTASRRSEQAPAFAAMRAAFR